MLAMAARLAGIDNEIVRCLYHFMLGVAVYQLAVALPGMVRLGALALASFALSAFATLVVPFHLVVPGLAAGTMLLCLALEARLGARAARACDWLGDATYGLYLWHIPVQVGLFLLLPAPDRLAEFAAQPWFLAAWVIGMLVVARLSYRWIELPARMAIRRLAAVRSRDAPIAAP